MNVPCVFTATQIHLFEFNIVPEILTAPKKVILNPDFAFLASEAAYGARQVAEKPVNTLNFVCQSFPQTTLRNSSFWSRYIKSDAGGGNPYWDLQIPFFLRPRRQSLEIMALPEKDRANVRADTYVMLNSLGWSTHVNITLKTPLRPSQLSDLCANLRDKAFGPPAYRMNGSDKTLKEIFNDYRTLLMQDIFSETMTYNRPPHIPHMIFVDVLQATGKPEPFQNLPLGYIQVLAGIIRRGNVQVRLQHENGVEFPVIDHMMITEIDPEFYNFSLTDFDQGSFTFLQTEAIQEKITSGPHCYSRNTRDAYLMSYVWLEAYRTIVELAKKKPKARALLECGRSSLRQLSTTYTSRTSLRLWQNHKAMGEFLKPDATE